MYCYILRFTLAPSRDFEQKIEKLLDFCEKAKIDEVMFFIAPEELALGHITINEAEKWVNVIVRAKNILEKRGIITSLNPWVTLMHNDAGRKLKSDQNFRTMVGIDGTITNSVVCPLCKIWRNYYIELWQYYIDQIEPTTLWFEDDMRLSNHEPVVLGCMCEEHIRILNKKLGTAYSRETLMEMVKTDETARKAFLEMQRFTLEDTFTYVIENLKGQKKFGVMTSGASAALRDARRHDVLYSILSKYGEKPTNRLNLGGYRQCGLQSYAWGINASAMWHRQIAGERAEFVSEIEDVPHSMYTKSANFMRYQLLSSAPLCLVGTTLSIFDFNGNGIINGERYAEMLQGIKPYLSKITELKLDPANLQGVYVLYHEDSAFTMKNCKDSPLDLFPRDGWWNAYLEQLGISCVMGSDINIKNRIVALGGEVVRNCTSEELRCLFANNFVLVDAGCASALYEMGLGDLIGAHSCEMWEERTGKYSMEQLATGEEVFGEKELRAMSIYFCGNHSHIEYADKNRIVYTKMLDYFEREVGDGIVKTQNALIFPYTGDSPDLDMPIALINPMREYAIKKALKENQVGKKDLFFVAEENVCPYAFDAGDRTYLLCVNFIDDEYAELHLYSEEKYDRIAVITPETPFEQDVEFAYMNGEYVIKQRLAPQSSLLFVCRKYI